jgi:hypothetical protein
MKYLGYSEKAYYAAQFTFEQLLHVLQTCTPFFQVVESLLPFCVPQGDGWVDRGTHLRFRRGCGHDLKEVFRFGILEPPTWPVRLTVTASAKWLQHSERIKEILTAHLLGSNELPAGQRQASLRAIGATGKDTVLTIWTTSSRSATRGFGLPPFDVIRAVRIYDAATGRLRSPEGLSDAREQAKQEGRNLIALVLVDDELPKEIHDEVMQQFRGMRALPLKPSSLSAAKGLPSWLNLTLMLAQKAGAVPWLLHDLPGTDDKTVFVGVDLGHNHRVGRSRLALTLFTHEGRPLGFRTLDFRENNERIPDHVLAHDLPRFILDYGRIPTQVIVHRDGRYFEGEDRAILDGLRGFERITLVSIKKDTTSRLPSPTPEGACIRLEGQRALLVTNAQAKKTGLPAPLEIELAEPGDQTLGNVVRQVFWLTRVCQGNAFFPKRLPVTTGWANNLADTGRAVHLKGWEYAADE